MNYIHPTALLGPNVVVGKDVYIGPYCVIGFPPEWKGKEELGRGVIIDDGARLTGLVTVDSGVETVTYIGKGAYMMKSSHAGHDVRIFDNCVISCGVKIGGHSVLEADVTVGLNAVIHQRLLIPRGVMIGMAGVITKTLRMQKFMKYAGNPAKLIGPNDAHPDYINLPTANVRYMKIACILLSLNRLDLTLRCIDQNFYNSEKDADVFLIDNGSIAEDFMKIQAHYPFSKVWRFKENQGIAKALNKGIELAEGYDAVVTLANDILMPQGWLKAMAEHTERIPETGMVGIHCVETLPELSPLGVHEIFTPFGNVLLTRAALTRVGGFNTKYGLYGMDDADYAYRLHYAKGFINYYVPGLKSEHIGHDVGNGTEYRRIKDESLAKAGDVLAEALEEYKQGKVFIPYK